MCKYKQLWNNSNEIFAYHPKQKKNRHYIKKLKKTIINKISWNKGWSTQGYKYTH